ncbi:uncharacterized protein LOC130677617 [Microplitis mediator]|uniref:uncharacterized protein LOC130677617 n=1 Tax=Microplitis mediator TaxID=375433 RepID=UPI002556F0E5|nr:uncharacterized protein LOC130677617 [Microplitis mediator]
MSRFASLVLLFLQLSIFLNNLHVCKVQGQLVREGSTTSAGDKSVLEEGTFADFKTDEDGDPKLDSMGLRELVVPTVAGLPDPKSKIHEQGTTTLNDGKVRSVQDDYVVVVGEKIGVNIVVDTLKVVTN